MNSLSRQQFAILVAFLFCLVSGLWLSDIGARKLANPDEGRYSVLAMHMADSGDYVTPRLNGLKYFEKPPMQYWATAVAFATFGKSDWSARLYTALCGLFTLLIAAYTAGRLVSREVGVFTALALVACPYFMALTEIVTLDMGLTFWTTLTVCAFLLSQVAQDRSARREALGWLCVAAVASAAAVLSKGLIGIVFPGAVLFLYCAIHWDWKRLAAINWWVAVPVFMLVVTPWFVLVARENPEFLRFFFIHEHFQRFTTTQHRRVEAWWFFIPILFVGVMAWALVLLPATLKAWWAGVTGDKAFSTGGLARPFQPMRFIVIWCVFIIVFFSISGSKLPAYILPTFPFIAILIAYYLATVTGRRLVWFVLPMPPAALALAYVLSIQPEKRARNPFELVLYNQYADILVPAFILFALGTAIAVACFWRASKVSRRWGVLLVAVASVFMVQRIDHGYEKLSPLQSGYALSQSIAAKITPQTRLYSVNTYDQTLAFYLGRYSTLVDYVDEFEMGQKSEPGRNIPKLEDFPTVWNAPGPVIAVIPPLDVDKMRGLGLDFDIIHESPRRFAIQKR
jgi:4-amino-4-deoxy-L-arabinose transferase-like glycosyltransferase